MINSNEVNIAKKVRKKSNKPFKSGLLVNTVIDTVNHPITNKKAYLFKEDKSYVEIYQCEDVL